MLINRQKREELNTLFYSLKLNNSGPKKSMDKQVKIEQIIAYLEVIHAEVRKMSRKRKVVLIDCGAGNCYLSYLVCYFYQNIDKREIEIHCIDTNEKLMLKNQRMANNLGFRHMQFHACDILDFTTKEKVNIAYSLHACDTATDKMMHLGLRCNARIILSVSCCQHSVKLKSNNLKPLIRHQSFRDKALMMILDSMRALLLEQEGYNVNIFDFVSSRYTDKNTMVRAVKADFSKNSKIEQEYDYISREFSIKPYLEQLIKQQAV